VTQLERARSGEAARLLTDAFLDDPAWVAVGPTSRRRRRWALRLFHWGELAEAWRFGGVLLGAGRDGELEGIAVTYDSTRYPAPSVANAYYLPGYVAAGPRATLRNMRADAVFERAHPQVAHLYLSLLAVAPAAQRTGVGARLLEVVFAEAARRELPVYLETTTPENVPYYTGHGFGVTGEAELPGGARTWFMWREHR